MPLPQRPTRHLGLGLGLEFGFGLGLAAHACAGNVVARAARTRAARAVGAHAVRALVEGGDCIELRAVHAPPPLGEQCLVREVGERGRVGVGVEGWG